VIAVVCMPRCLEGTVVRAWKSGGGACQAWFSSSTAAELRDAFHHQLSQTAQCSALLVVTAARAGLLGEESCLGADTPRTTRTWLSWGACFVYRLRRWPRTAQTM